MKQWKIIAKHKWVVGATITESINETKSTKDKIYCRFTATIRGWNNWKLFEGYGNMNIYNKVQQKVIQIRDKIDNVAKQIFNEEVTYEDLD